MAITVNENVITYMDLMARLMLVLNENTGAGEPAEATAIRAELTSMEASYPDDINPLPKTAAATLPWILAGYGRTAFTIPEV